jgi:predicted DCC family thiol-disulfide oxidoreductase YuxK
MNKKIILFDGPCALCNHSVKLIRRYDRRKVFSFLPLQSKKGQLLLKTYGEIRDDSVILIDEEQQIYFKSTAVFKIVRELDGVSWRLLYVFRYLPTFFNDLVYDLIAKFRYRIFGKAGTCEIEEV